MRASPGETCGSGRPPRPSGERVAEGRVRGSPQAKIPLTGPPGHLSPARGEGVARVRLAGCAFLARSPSLAERTR